MKILKTIDRIYRGKASRREFVEGMLALGVTPLLGSAFARGGALLDPPLTTLTWSQLEDPRANPGFSNKYLRPQSQFFNDETVSIQSLNPFNMPNVIYPSYSLLPSWKEKQLIPLDERKLAHLRDMHPELLGLAGTAAATGRVFVPLFWGTTSFIYRPDLVELKEESWSVFFDPKYSGKTEMWDSAEGVIPAASLALGMTSGIHDPQGDSLKRVRSLLNEWCPKLRYFPGSTGNDIEAFARGEIQIAFSWSGHAGIMKKLTKTPMKWATPKEGSPMFVCGLSCGREFHDMNAVYDFINAATSPEAGRHIFEMYGYHPANLKAAPESTAALGLASENHFFENVSLERRVQQLDMFRLAKLGRC